MNNVLVVVDMQNDFITGALGSEAARDLVPRVVQKIKDFNGIVTGTLDTHESDYLFTKEGRNLPVAHCIMGTHGWKVKQVIENAVADKKDFRDFYIKDTFGCVDLAQDLRDEFYNGTKGLRIELVGLITDICVVSNALLLKAYMPEAEIVVDASCCEGTSIENHEAALQVMRSCHITVIND